MPGGSTPNWPFKRRLLSRVGVPAGAAAVADSRRGVRLLPDSRDRSPQSVAIKAGGFKICLELIVRGWPTRLVEIPYRFDDRELGESKMSTREAAGYLVQLRDLYRLRWSGRAGRSGDYRQLTRDEVENDRSGRALIGTARPAARRRCTGAPKITRDATCQATLHFVDASRQTSPAWRAR